MWDNDEPAFDEVITDLEGQQEPHASSPRQRRWRLGVLVLLVVSLLAGGELVWAARPLLQESQNGQTMASSTPAPTPVSPAVFASLAARLLHFPAGITLATCPVSAGQPTNPDFYGSVAGTGPLYLGVVSPDGTVAYTPASTWGDGYGWGGIPGSFWISRGNFGGPVLVRGKRLDAAGEVRFDTSPTMVLSGGASLVAALPMVILAQPTVPYQLDGIWRVRFNAPGCYGLQIDWPQGTEQIIVRAEAEQGTG